jgi:CMP-N,N'-diacetyllegionaminic acid synthase
MNYLFTICGRAGSKGVKNKNLKNFLDCPLVYYSLAAIYLYKEKYGKDDNITAALNTDSAELIKIVAAQKILPVYVISREENLCGDFVSKVDVIKDCLEKAQAKYPAPYDMVIDLDITSPLRTVLDLKNVIDRKNNRHDTDAVYTVTHARRNPYFNMVREKDEYFVKAIASDYTARQQAPAMYDMNASIYAYSPAALAAKPSNIFFNSKADAVIMKDTAVLDIDSEEDFELMQVIAGHVYNTDARYNIIKNTAEKMESNNHE